MLRLAEDVKIYVANRPTDGRKSINGLTAMIVEEYEGKPQEGSVYVFYNKDKDRVKCIFWDKNGFVLYHKRLERGKFKFTRRDKTTYAITQQQLDWLLAGLDFTLMSEFPLLDFTHYF